MKNGLNFAAQSDPSRNGQFLRRWTEPPRYSVIKIPKAASAKDVANRRWKRQCARLRQLGGRSGGEA